MRKSRKSVSTALLLTLVATGAADGSDGIPEAAARLERVMTTDPGTGAMRHADAGYEKAITVARERGVKLPMPGS